ncbi:glycosyltransferase [Clostridium sp. 'White wine YQ']|uniref:glycosyltransferase n=1 Tax=Clostridium sp. 'White wine YQ' TaxID=3027474 RepID=UPI0023658802|nr:glycosyltransferase [Clostridium sp. 'White wine YQ']MDD7792745.1 glycosyltransferase [Clostridium sp. 'White wine YQ']
MARYKIDLICPLYKAEKYIEDLHKSLLMQSGSFDLNIKYVLTKVEKDNTENILKRINAHYKAIKPEEFSHSLTREKEAFESNGDVIVFITQDIIIRDSSWLEKLTSPIIRKECEASFSRQICENKSIERYTRINNYPEDSRIVSKDDIERLGIMTFFFSDAASAVDNKIFKELNGYDAKNLLTNEDMYFAHKLINSGYRIKYCADAQVIHSHDYKFSELFKRYFDQGVFLKQNSYLAKYRANESAFKLLRLVLVKSLVEGNLKAFFNVIPNFAARFLGNSYGKKYDKLSRNKIKKYSSNKYYWENN